MPLDDIQRHVADYTSRFEAGRRNEFLPGMKPPVRGPLSLVGWVQNGNLDPTLQAKLVLQSAIVPIQGDLGLSSGTTPEAAPVPPQQPVESSQAAPPAASTQPAPSASPTEPAANLGNPDTSTPPPPALPE